MEMLGFSVEMFEFLTPQELCAFTSLICTKLSIECYTRKLYDLGQALHGAANAAKEIQADRERKAECGVAVPAEQQTKLT